MGSLQGRASLIMTISSYNKVVIDTRNLQHNLRVLGELLGPQTDIMAMVKSDAYGHGLEASAAAFARENCTKFGVAEIAEGVELRNSGCTGDILIFLGFDPRYGDYFFSHDLTPLIFSREDLTTIATLAENKKQKISIYLKFDCGMSRLGFKPREGQELFSLVDDSRYLVLKGIMSHYPCSDNRNSENSHDVYRLFTGIVESMDRMKRPVMSACNSGGTLYFPETHGELVRTGISLYGYCPDSEEGRKTITGKKLKPAMSYISRVLQVNEVSRGAGISYGHTFTAQYDMKLAALPVGYSNGYPRIVSNRAEVLINGKRAPIRGRICMNLCMADITEIEGVSAGDEVVLLGSQGSETIDADEIASWADTINYEILCSLGNNNQRIYI